MCKNRRNVFESLHTFYQPTLVFHSMPTISSAPRSKKGHANFAFTTELKEHGYSVKDSTPKRREAIESAFNRLTLEDKDHIVLGRIRDYLRNLERLHKSRSPENSARYGSDAVWVEQMLKDQPAEDDDDIEKVLREKRAKKPRGKSAFPKAADVSAEYDPLASIVDGPNDMFDADDPNEEVIAGRQGQKRKELDDAGPQAAPLGQDDGSAAKRQKRPAFEKTTEKKKKRRRRVARPEKGRTAYEVLGLGTDATEKEIGKAFRTLSLRHHPDKNGGQHSEEYLYIVRAHEVLSDLLTRRAYDALLGIRSDAPDVVAPPNQEDADIASGMMDVDMPAASVLGKRRDRGEEESKEDGARRKRSREAPTVEEINRERARAARGAKSKAAEEKTVKEEGDEQGAAEKPKPAPSRKRRGDDEGRDFDTEAERLRLLEKYPGIDRNIGAVDRMIEAARKRHTESGPTNRPRRKRRLVDYAELNGRGRVDREDGSGVGSSSYFAMAFAARAARR